MANLNETSKGILGKASEKIGNYTESTGGGTPLAKGEKLKDHPEAKRVMQPRDEDGQFTYNSVNGHGLKYGPSRGTTVPPFLRGVKLTFCQPGTKLKIDGPDGIKVRLMTIDMTVEEIVHACKQYIESEEGFAGMGEGSSILKKGRKSKEEKNADAGQIGNVDPKTLSQGTQDEMAKAASDYAKNNSADASPVNPTVTEAMREKFVNPGNQQGYKVVTDTLNPDGTTTKNTTDRYNKWFQKNNIPAAKPQAQAQPTPTQQSQQNQQPQQNQTPVTPSGAQAPQKPQGPTLSGLASKISSYISSLNSGTSNNSGQNTSPQGNNNAKKPNISLSGFLSKKNKV